MTVENLSQESARGSPWALRTAQAAIHLPEVQEMLRRLAKFELGIFIPHMHDDQTGEFRPLPNHMMQVESGSEVSFQPAEKIARQADRFLPVGWCWRAGAPTPVTACEMTQDDGRGDTECLIKHKMLKIE